ncbi:MAG TPA: alpha/beta hydrolase [Candidatus Deferrimicrobium sp.]|nr:alpha/beta hydrolase [Candidatus Deferrimicrobium sp.]
MTTDSEPGAGFVRVADLDVYYETHGSGPPLVLLHGAMSATGTSFGAILPALAERHRVISIEQQAHGHTAAIDRPLRIPTMARDTAAVLHALDIDRADVLGYSMGAGVALQLALDEPAFVGRLALVSITYDPSGFHPGLMAGLDQLTPDQVMGSPWHTEYLSIAPRPEDFPTMVEQVKDMNRNIPSFSEDQIRGIAAPTLIVVGDSDIVTPEHAVAMFRLRGGGVVGDLAGLPPSQLAILPGTPHSSIMRRSDLLVPILTAFLDAPMPNAAS